MYIPLFPKGHQARRQGPIEYVGQDTLAKIRCQLQGPCRSKLKPGMRSRPLPAAFRTRQDRKRAYARGFSGGAELDIIGTFAEKKS
jgi:hypothetical protein